MREIENPPIAENTIEASSSVGNYTLALSLADLIDNSITAEAKDIWINEIFDRLNSTITIIDNGKGMSEKQLIKAMKFASSNPSEQREKNDLGRFGLGLKTASLSQGRCLTVLTCNGIDFSGASWDQDDCKDWKMKVFDKEEVQKKFTFNTDKNQTEVILSNLVRLTENGTIDETIWNNLIIEARSEIQLIFHRYIEGLEKGLNKINIYFNDLLIEPNNPFHNKHPACEELPTTAVPYQKNGINAKIKITPFILPHFSKLKPTEYEKLGGKEGYVRNQGFYVYRNHRLIIKGTWFKLTPHGELGKLARVRIDIPNTLDNEWKITVDKSEAQIPNWLRSDLKNIIQTITNSSARRFIKRGKKLSNSNIAEIWDLKLKEGKKFFSVNEKHPMIESFYSSLDAFGKNEFKKVISLIEETLPLSTLHSEYSDNPDQIHQGTEDPETIYEIAKTFFLKQQSIGISSDDILKKMKYSSPTAQSYDFIISKLQKEGIYSKNDN
jgi:hypothetical protein